MKKIILLSLIYCVAACSPIKKYNTDCVGEAKPGCMCTMQYDPVCGCNNVTYSNACVANCAGIKSTIKGACQEKK